MNIPLSKPFFDKEETEEIKKVLETGWVAGQGPKNKELEEEFAKYIGVKHAICISNCTAALHLALLALGIGRGDEVIVPDFTFPATAHAVLYVNAKPVFIDIDPTTFNINTKLIEKKITKNTKAIIPVHMFGLCADMDSIIKIAKKHSLFVIEDAACAVGNKYKRRFAGSMGDVGCFSFHARKNITSGEGGIITTNNQEIADTIRSLSCFGMTSAFSREKDFHIPTFTKLGYNYKLSDIAAAITLIQLKRSEKFIEKRRQLAEYYNEKLKDIKQVQCPVAEEYNRHVYQAYTILLDKNINRNDLITRLKEKGIQTQIGTYALHMQPVYSNVAECNEQDFPVTKIVFEQSLALPMYNELTFEEIDYIVSELKEILK
ncbi:DegT/DnrJ/EryC1/StrS family aminotransferase [Candidatus Woesearchaeota archaeon]|nr:DegT/DnrJ/EryC1/StrS family aminotransferase [Candidatus Woesearchaeota archaeon]